MKFNAQTFWRVFALLSMLELLLFATGCTSTWITAVSGLLPAISAIVNAVVAFIAQLEGKTVSADVYAAIEKWQANIASELSNVSTILADIQKAATSGLIAQLQGGMQVVLTEFNSILSGLDITDSDTVAKLTQFVSLGIAAVNAVLALIPAITAVMAKVEAGSLPKSVLAKADAIGGSLVKVTLNTVKETYATILSSYTDNAEVNAALDTLPRSI